MLEDFELLKELPQYLKQIYVQILAAQASAEGELRSDDLVQLYVFMQQLELDPKARNEVLKYLQAHQFDHLPAMANLLVSKVRPTDALGIKIRLLTDLIRIATIAPAARKEANVEQIAFALFDHSQSRASRIVEFLSVKVEYETKLLKGELTPEEAQAQAKEIVRNGVATGAAIGVPLALVSSLGATAGVSAAGMTSGLAALGMGGLLGFSSMLTGIGVVAGLGILSYSAVKFVTRDKNARPKREEVMQAMLEAQQKAALLMAQDFIRLVF